MGEVKEIVENWVNKNRAFLTMKNLYFWSCFSWYGDEKGLKKWHFLRCQWYTTFTSCHFLFRQEITKKRAFFSTYFRVKNCKKHFSYLFKNKSMKYHHDINFDIFLSFLWGISETIFAKENLSVLRSLSLLFVRRRRPSPSPSRVFSCVHSVLLSLGAKILITLIESHHETMKLF